MDKNNQNQNNVKCFICDRHYKNTDNPFVQVQIDGYEKPVFLCAECIAKLANQVGILEDDDNAWGLEEEGWDESSNKKQKLNYKRTSPLKIKKYLDGYIIGQENAKRIISVAYYNHLKRVSLPEKNKYKVKKSNILMVGPTGSGKTLIAKKLAEMSHVPFVSVDATTFTKKGYVGEDVESILSKLYMNANYDLEATEKGIVYIDECDKLSSKSINGLSADYVGSEAVQQSLLKLIEGNDVVISNLKNENKQSLTINTSNILFIMGGAFSGIDKIYNERKKKSKSFIGFSMTENKEGIKNKDFLFDDLESEDFIKYGLIPELIGRLPVIAFLNKLTKNDLIQVLSIPKDSICNEYKYLFKMDNINLDFSKESLIFIADEAIKKNLGARGLRSILESKLNNLMFDYSNQKNNVKSISITKDFLLNAKEHKPVIIFKHNIKKPSIANNKVHTNLEKVGASIE